MWAVLKLWLHDWGDLLLTTVIAGGAIGQFWFSRRLTLLEEYRDRVIVLVQLEDRVGPQLRIANLSHFGVWVERIDATACDTNQTISTAVRQVIPASTSESFGFRFPSAVGHPSLVEVVAYCGNDRTVATNAIRRKISMTQDSAGGVRTTIDPE